MIPCDEKRSARFRDFTVFSRRDDWVNGNDAKLTPIGSIWKKAFWLVHFSFPVTFQPLLTSAATCDYPERFKVTELSLNFVMDLVPRYDTSEDTRVGRCGLLSERNVWWVNNMGC